MGEEKMILEGLNDEQLSAVKCVDGPVLIVAGAGSGKTRVLTSRIAYMLRSGVEPSSVMALTFTKKAAEEMKERISAMVGERNARRLVMGTFHSVFIRFLRQYAPSLGYPESFTIYDTSDSVSCLKACVKELALDDKAYKPKLLLSRISMAKNNLYTSASYKSIPGIFQKDSQAKLPRFCDVFALYEKKCRQSGVMDFDDVLVNMNVLLRDNVAALDDIAGRFSHILVDEYQDTNYAQYVILRRLTKFHHNLCVVGDDSQSIYAFRGAKVENILNFRKDYPECSIFRLERNYRSTQVIVDAANSLIEKNSARIPKKCYAVGEQGDSIQVIRAADEAEEARSIVNEIVFRMMREKAAYEDFAILYRTNNQSRVLEEVLRNRNIPYIIYSGNSFFERAEVKDVMAYFKLAVNVNDDESFKRIVNTPARGIGDTTLLSLAKAAQANACSMFKAVFLPESELVGLRAAAISKLRSFCEMVSRWAEMAREGDALDTARRIIDESTYLLSLKAENTIESLARAGNVEELVNSVASFVAETQNARFEDMQEEGMEMSEENISLVTLGEFLENVTLLSNADTDDGDDSTNKVKLMTVHSAKGLEFPYVFIAGMEENLFPSGGMLITPAEIEEERRLFYVALTRAKKNVAVSFARQRMRNGSHESNAPSRFLKEIDQSFLDSPLGEADFRVEENPWHGGRFGPSRPSSPFQRPSGPFTRQGGSFPRPAGQPQRPQTPSGGRPVAAPAQRPAAAPAPRPDNPNFVPSAMSSFRVGQMVEHVRFGRGRLTALEGSGVDVKATVQFEEFGSKVILLRFGKMRVLD